ncbi:MAG: hypothetical protein CVU39_15435 [Chloroflexi bacterium HGW-Chloroflexi-10]|nr:MAG: hypothetical protein CVU39_15435 [Chloroflexi bacterium HGW-Chloroflexi-10]
MRIIVISTSKIPSTTANSIQVMKVCQAYRQLGHEVQLFVPGDTVFDWAEIQKQYGLSSQFTIAWFAANRRMHRYDFAWNAVYMAKSYHADIIHTWTPQATYFSLLRKIPVLMELHELPSGKFGPILYRQIFINNNRKRFLSITDGLKRKYEEQYRFTFHPDEICISPDGVDIERYQNLPSANQARIKLGLPDRWSVAFTGHFYQGRGTDLLYGLAKQLPHIQFIWVGGREEDLEFWREKIRCEEIKNIVITGFIHNELIPLYQSAGDILLMPYSRRISGSSGGNIAEVFSPMKMFEYMAARRTIICSDLPILHEVLNEKNAIFCEPEELSAWSEAINRVSQNETLQKILANQSWEDVQQYSWIERAKNGLEGFV